MLITTFEIEIQALEILMFKETFLLDLGVVFDRYLKEESNYSLISELSQVTQLFSPYLG